MKPLHEELKQLREEQQLSLKEIAKRTRIRLDFLKKLETGDYSVAPMPFVRAFFREYAEVLEIDPANAMAKLDGKLDTILDPRPAPEPAIAAPEPVETVLEEADTVSEDDTAATGPEEAKTEEQSEPEQETESEPEIQQSLFDETTESDDADSPEQEAPVDDSKDEPEADDSEDDSESETESAVIDDEPGQEETTASEIVEPVTAIETAPEDSPEPVTPVKDGIHEIDLDENGSPQPTVRRPLEIETEKSFSNIIYAAIVAIMLVIAGIMIYLNRADIF